MGAFYSIIRLIISLAQLHRDGVEVLSKIKFTYSVKTTIKLIFNV